MPDAPRIKELEAMLEGGCGLFILYNYYSKR